MHGRRRQNQLHRAKSTRARLMTWNAYNNTWRTSRNVLSACVHTAFNDKRIYYVKISWNCLNRAFLYCGDSDGDVRTCLAGVGDYAYSNTVASGVKRGHNQHAFYRGRISPKNWHLTWLWTMNMKSRRSAVRRRYLTQNSSLSQS